MGRNRSSSCQQSCRPYRWRFQRGHDERPTGKVDFRMGSLHEVEALQRAVGSDVVEVNGVIVLTEVYSEALAARRLQAPLL